MPKDTNIVWGNSDELIVRSTTDDLYIMPWKLLHDGHSITRQETVVSVSTDAGEPISHSRFTAGGRIMDSKIYVDREEIFWLWYALATNNRALPCWIYDVKLDGFMRCHILEQPNMTPAGNSVMGMFVNLKLYAKSASVPVRNFITENTPERIVVDANGILSYIGEEIMY